MFTLKIRIIIILFALTTAQRVQISYAQALEDKFLQSYYRDVHNKFYVDIGAFHPIALSNTLKLYSQNWRGINIQPNPNQYPIFNDVRMEQTNMNIGVKDSDSFETFFGFSDPIVSTMSEEVKNKWKTKGKNADIKIPTFKLSTLCERYFPEKPQFMSLDAQGLGYKILSQNDWTKDKCRPNLIISEDNELNPLTGDPLPITILQENNYTLIKKVGKNQVFAANHLVQEYNKLQKQNQQAIKKTMFYAKPNLNKQLTSVFKSKTVLGDQYNSAYDPKSWPVYLKFGRKNQIISTRQLQQRSKMADSSSRSRPIFIFEYDMIGSYIVVESQNYTIGKLPIQNDIKFYNLTVYPQNGQDSYNIYIFDHQYQGQVSPKIIVAQQNKGRQQNTQIPHQKTQIIQKQDIKQIAQGIKLSERMTEVLHQKIAISAQNIKKIQQSQQKLLIVINQLKQKSYQPIILTQLKEKSMQLLQITLGLQNASSQYSNDNKYVLQLSQIIILILCIILILLLIILIIQCISCCQKKPKKAYKLIKTKKQKIEDDEQNMIQD